MLEKERIAIETLKENKLYRNNEENLFRIIWTHLDNCEIMLDKEKLNIGLGEIALLMPENTVQIQLLKQAEVHVISFSAAYLQLEARLFSTDLFKLFISHATNKVLNIDPENLEIISSLRNLLNKLNNADLVDQKIRVNLINAILLCLIKVNHQYISVSDKYINRIHDFFILIFKHSRQQKRVSFYANELHISPKRLNQILQAMTKHSASFFIQEHIILEAKRYLLFSELNINQIANKLGFVDVAYFSRFFKKWIGMSPEKYRKA